MSLAVTFMAKKTRGRPKGSGRITTRFSMVATSDYLDWLSRLAYHVGEVESSDAVRRAIRMLARDSGFEDPPIR
jgi:hypothetical protein